MVKKQYESMDVRVRGLMIAAGAIKDSISKGNKLVEGMNGSYLSDITSYSTQLKGDFTSLSDEFKAGRMTLQEYVGRLNVFVAMLNAGVTDEDALGAEEIKKEYLRVKQLLAEGNSTGEYVAKGKLDNPILSNQELIKSNIYACYNKTNNVNTDRLEQTEVADPIIKSKKSESANQTSSVTKDTIDKAFAWLEGFSAKKK